jgi:hypothetical protein
VNAIVGLLLPLLAMLGGWFAVAALYQAATGGNVARMFGGSSSEVVIQAIGALGALALALEIMT